MRLPDYRPDFQKLYQECNPPQACPHRSTSLRNKPDKNNKPRYHLQCLSCGSAVGRRVPQADVPDGGSHIPLFDLELDRRSWADFHRRYEAKKEEARQRARQLWERDYNRYLNTPDWRAKRSLVLHRAQGICEGCRMVPAVEVHHTSYDHVGEEFLFQLLALCESCHRRYHSHYFPRFLEGLFLAGLGHQPPVDDDIDF